ncbi:MAG: hypothetical protein JO256_02215 [Alphaproteobacteria bacterium]|nr:hypothetical protein [Alphaproteobacteria bacterium]
MNKHLLALGGLALLAACGARPPSQPQWNPYSALEPRDENYHGGPGAALQKYDANKDGTLILAELTAGLRAEFDQYDTAKTGCLSPEQVAAINQARVQADQSTATPLQDWNQDGCVSFQEFATAPASLFDELDVNHDGKVTAQEFDRAAGRGGRGEPGRGDNEPGRGGRGRP